MAISVDNLNNLFWDNGSWKYPNTYPKLVNGKYLPNVTPVMTSPLTGWVILEGEWNYALFNEQLYFLKKDKLISLSKNKWRYFLIKDHICTLFRNKANVIATGTITNIDLEHLHNKDFQFTLPVFNSFNKRVLLPLTEEKWHWKKHISPILITKKFSEEKLFGNREYTDFVNTLEANKQLFENNNLDLNKQKEYKHFTLLAKTNRTKKGYNWKNQLVDKINNFLSTLTTNDDIVLGKVDPDKLNAQAIKTKWAITSKSKRSLIKNIESDKQVLEDSLDFSGLEDIVLVSFTDGQKDNRTAFFQVKYEHLGGIDQYLGSGTYIKKLTRRVRTPLLNPYTSRAIYRTGDKFSTWFQQKPNTEHLLPQKIFFELTENLEQPEDKYSRYFPAERKNKVFRSVYLYLCWYLDFTLQYTTYPEAKRHLFKETDFVDPESYFGGKDACSSNMNCALAISTVYSSTDSKGIKIRNEDSYESYYPWKEGGNLNTKKPINMGWVVGQFSPLISDNKELFHPWATFKVKTKKEKWKRIVGLKKLVKTLTTENTIFKKPKNKQSQDKPLNLDIFGSLPPRLRQATLEEDYLIGEKLLFTTWGLPAYLLFQPSKDSSYSNFEYKELDRPDGKYKPSQLLGKWLQIENSWGYAYYVFDDGNYFTDYAKSWFKKAYDSFKPLEYKRFYANQNLFKSLETHIEKNTEAYFETEEVTLANTPLGELAQDNIFFSDQEWFFYDDAEARSFAQEKGDWFNKEIDRSVELETGDIVVYYDFESGKLCVGETTVWEDKVKLPEGQFIAVNAQINNPSSANNELPVKYYKIKKLSDYTSLSEIITSVKQEVTQGDRKLFNDIADISLDRLTGNTEYLFDLKGTNFYCFLDQNKNVHLIFKNDSNAVGTIDKKTYTVEGSESLNTLSKTQWVNQKVNLSAYGQKIELPVKAFEKRVIAQISLQPIADPEWSRESIETKKIEVKHDLGTLYLTLNAVKEKTSGQAQFSGFELESINMQYSRSLQNYVNTKRDYELNLDRMELGHKQARYEQYMTKTNSIIGLVSSVVGGVTGGATSLLTSAAGMLTSGNAATPDIISNRVEGWGGGVGAPLSKAFNVGATGARFVRSISNPIMGIATSALNLSAAQQRKAFMEEKIATDLKEKIYQSYNIDLEFERQKTNHAFSLRRLFSQDSYNEMNDRTRSKLLDSLEPELKGKIENEIYLEVWTTSAEQDERVKDYHNKYGVECRLPEQKIVFKNGIEPGIYQLEDVEISNLKDRLELLFLKTRLEVGIKLVNWVEHEKVDELIPVDPRIQKLQEALKIAERRQVELEQNRVIQEGRLKQLETTLKEDDEKIQQQEATIKEKELSISTLQGTVAQKEKEAQVEAGKYRALSESYRKLEEEKKLEEQQKHLYYEMHKVSEEDLKTEKSKTKKLEGEKKALEDKDKEKQLQLNNLTQENNSLKQEKEELNSKFSKCEEEKLKLIGEKNKCIEDGQKKNQELEQEVNTQKQLVTEKENTLQLKLSELLKMENDKKALELEVEQLKLQKQTAEREKESARIAKEAAEQEKYLAQNEKEAEKQKLSLKELELEQLKKEIERCKQDAQSQQEELAEAKEKLTKLEESGGELPLFPSGYLDGIFVNTLTYKKQRRASSLLMVVPSMVLTKNIGSDYAHPIKVLRWSSELQIFLEDTYYDCIWAYDGYKLFYVGNSKNNNQSEAKNIVIDDAYWNNYSGGSYFNHKIQTWEDVKHHILGAHQGATQKACMNWEHVIFSDNCFNIPYIPKEELREIGKPWEENFRLELSQPDTENDTSLNCLYACSGNDPEKQAWLWDEKEKKFFFGPNKEKGKSPRYWWPVEYTKVPWAKVGGQEDIITGQRYHQKFHAAWWKGRTKEVTSFFFWLFRLSFNDTYHLGLKNISDWQAKLFKKLTHLWEHKPDLATELYNHFIKNIKQINNYGDYKRVLGIKRPTETPLFKKVLNYNYEEAFI